MIDRRFARSSIYLLICAVLSLFGIIHSPYPNGDMLLPWKAEGMPQQIAWQFFSAYLITAIVIFLLSRKSTPEQIADAA